MKYLLKIILVCVITLSMTSAIALKMKPVNLQQLVGYSDFVALVEIKSSQTIKSDTVSCGVEYIAKVDNTLKGRTDDVLSFGYMKGLKMGKKYLIFVNKNTLESKLTIFTTTNFQKQFSDKENLSECKKLQLAGYILAQAGLAYFEVEPTEIFNLKPGVKIRMQYFRLPDNIKSVEDKLTPTIRWVKLDDLLRMINNKQ